MLSFLSFLQVEFHSPNYDFCVILRKKCGLQLVVNK
jgi:hypothetical protein